MSGLSVNTISGTLAAGYQVQRIQQSLTNTMTQLSTGLRINSAKDDPAGLIAQELLRSDITAANAAVKNTQLANAMMNVAESGMSQISQLLIEAKGLAVEAANSGAMSPEQVAANQTQLNAILDSIDRFSAATQWLGKPLLDGSLSEENGGATFQIGPNVVSSQQVNVDLDSVRTASIGTGGVSLADLRSGRTASLASNPALADKVITAAIGQLASQRADIGATQKYTFDPNITYLQDTLVQLTAAKSLISDTDFAAAASNLVRDQILMGAAMSALALANQNRSYAASLI